MADTGNLERLWAMREAGALTDAEYQSLKAKELDDSPGTGKGPTNAAPSAPTATAEFSSSCLPRDTAESAPDSQRTAPVRRVGFWLTVSIVLAPIIAVWLLLRQGYSRFARVAGFGWLAIFLAALSALPPARGVQSVGAGPSTIAQKVDVKPSSGPTPKDKIQPFITFGYTDKTDPGLSKRLGRKGFELASSLDRGVYLATAESARCDKVTGDFVAEEATEKDLFWFADCENQNRFRVTADQARMALLREKDPRAVDPNVPPVVEPACTFSNVNACSYSEDQKKFKEADAVSACDAILDRAVLSLPSLNKAWTFDYGMTKPNRVAVERDFSSSNAFGAQLSSRYRCEIDAATGGIKKFKIRQLNGWKRVI